MDIQFVNSFDQESDNLGVGVFAGKKLTAPAKALDEKFGGVISSALEVSTSVGKFGKVIEVFGSDGHGNKRIFLIGLGEEDQLTQLRLQKIGGHVYKHLKNKSVFSPTFNLGIEKCKDAPVSKSVAHLAYGMRLCSWRFDKYFTQQKNDDIPNIQGVQLVVADKEQADEEFFALNCVAEGVARAKNLVIEPPNILYPEAYAETVTQLRQYGIDVEILDEKALRKLGMNSLLGVAQGSVKTPKVVIMKWNGASDKNETPIAFVGKGVCFDSGGLSLKTPSVHMEKMKYDMGGSAVVVGLMQTLAQRRAKVNVVGAIGLVENMPSGEALRPGDVLTSMSGQTIEVLNTDAEGRLVLADVLWYTKEKFQPKIMVDLATLTGAVVVSLADEYAGLFSNNDNLANKLLASGINTHEKLWRLPICKAFDKAIDSDIADMRNTSTIKGAGSSTAAQFLQRFVGDTPWAHLDIAGVTWDKKGIAYCSEKGPTGFGVKLLNDFVVQNYENNVDVNIEKVADDVDEE